MAARKTKKSASEKPVPRRRTMASGFDALSIEGGLLSSEWLDRIAKLSAGRQSESDYRIPKGLNLRDEIGRYWRVGQAHWGEFETSLAAGSDKRASAEKFATALLRDCFGFVSLAATKPIVREERIYPIGWYALTGRVPLVVAPAGSGLDERFAELGDENRKRSAFGLAQEYLNVEESAHWGLASDGKSLRLLRDNASLTRPAWIHADLARIFTEQRYPDFTALWLLIHETRFGAPDAAPTDSPLEMWRAAGREEGTRAREHLRTGVEAALLSLGQGFLAHPANTDLRTAAEKGALTPEAYYQELLRLAYRLIFLLTAEERSVLHPASASREARDRYDAGYSMKRLRERAVRRNAHDRFHDLWDGLSVALRGLASGEPALGLPALVGIFAADRCPTLNGAKLENRHLLFAILQLAWLREDDGLSRVNWRDMGPEELGSVYESLLELVPRFSDSGRVFSFASGGEAKGNARKTTGSYYTPDSLVQVLLDGALEPVVADRIAKNPGNEVEALLSLSVVDPACGSGHFLLSAARRLAGHIARLEAKGTPSIADYRHALRQVVSRCIFGVDLNAMAVELCKVSLWMEAVEPGLPLSFLDSHIQHGNSLIGTAPELIAKGIPDEAWEPIEGDDRKTASSLKKRNKQSAGGQRSMDTLFAKPSEAETKAVAAAVGELDAASDADAEALAKKESRWEGILGSTEYRHQKFVADAWCAAFVWPKQLGPLAEAAPTNDAWLALRDGQGQPAVLMKRTVEELADQYHFFHWHLQFPQVFAKGGFDVVIGNPPWEMPETDDRVFFAPISQSIASEPSPKKREELAEALFDADPNVLARWRSYLRGAEGLRAFVVSSGRFPFSSIGRLNFCRIFIEHGSTIISARGVASLVIQSGLWSAEYDRPLWLEFVRKRCVISIFDFENKRRLFPAVDSRARFALLTVSRNPRPALEVAFWVHDPLELRAAERRQSLSFDLIESLEPETKSIPQLRSPRDLRLLSEANGRCARFGESPDFPHTLRLMFSSSDSAFEVVDFDTIEDRRAQIQTRPAEWVPVYEGKMVGLFDHRAADIIVNRKNASRPAQEKEIPDTEKGDPSRLARPQSWIRATAVRTRRFGQTTGQGDWELVFCDVTASTNERTAVASIVPLSGLNRSVPAIYFVDPSAQKASSALAMISSMAFDYFARLRVSSNHLTQGILETLPVPKGLQAWPFDEAFLGQRVLELSYTAWDLGAFAKGLGYDGPPFRWDPERRFLLRGELDAAFFHLYGLSRDDTEYVLDAFPIVRKNDEKAHREYRTKRVVLEIYDEMARAMASGKPYLTRLDPPAADSRVAHRLTADRLVAPGVNSWSRPHLDERQETGALLAAILKAIQGPSRIEEIRLAAVLALFPRLLTPWLEKREGDLWQKSIGAEAKALTGSVKALVPPATATWGAVVKQLRGSGLLVEDAAAKTWAAGAGLGAIDTDGWPEGRARFVLSFLQKKKLADLVSELPRDLGVWVKSGKAA